MTPEALPWLVFPPAVDLANTVVVTAAGDHDLLTSDDELGAWIAAEQERIAGVEAAARRLPEVRDLRENVRALLHAVARGKRPPEGARKRINAISASAPIRTTLSRDGRAVSEHDARDPFALFEATVAHSAIELADRGDDRLRACEAPSCGMLFIQEHPRQVWCTPACGNRARVARHAARHARRPDRATGESTGGRPSREPSS
jgi:predicted RNA-binding Zn ribbon-like protein